MKEIVIIVVLALAIVADTTVIATVYPQSAMADCGSSNCP
jgi:hypothetical protein